MRGSRLSIPLILAALAACGGPPGPVVTAPGGPARAPSPPARIAGSSPHALGSGAPVDPQVAAIVERYKTELGSKLSVPLIQATADISPDGEPSNALGLLVADEMLAFLQARPGEAVDCFVTNDGGLRAPLYAGTVQLSHVYEVMPFDNELVIVEMDAPTLQRLADQVAKKKGEPVAGLRLAIDPAAGRATEVRIQGREVDPARRYRVGTTDYLADSGWLSDIVKGQTIIRTGILMRDAIVQRFEVRAQAGGALAPALDDRIRVVPEARP